jgi:hypothetical protein
VVPALRLDVKALLVFKQNEVGCKVPDQLMVDIST